MITIELTVKQLEKLEDSLSCLQDEGPYGSGWASDELVELRCIVAKAVQKGIDKSVDHSEH